MSAALLSLPGGSGHVDCRSSRRSCGTSTWGWAAALTVLSRTTSSMSSLVGPRSSPIPFTQSPPPPIYAHARTCTHPRTHARRLSSLPCLFALFLPVHAVRLCSSVRDVPLFMPPWCSPFIHFAHSILPRLCWLTFRRAHVLI